MPLFEDFKKFAFKGNVIDLAVGVIIGAAFGKIVSALVADLVMPLVSLVLPTGDWRNHGLVLRHGESVKDDVVLKWGDFLGTLLDFFVVAIVLYLAVSKILRVAEARLHGQKDATTKECPLCLETIPVKATRCKACTSLLKAA
jgi:large conductance mechanosensitive channel